MYKTHKKYSRIEIFLLFFVKLYKNKEDYLFASIPRYMIFLDAF